MVKQTEVAGRRVFTLDLPLRVRTSSKKKTALNLNVYRNLHHRSLHAQKKKFEELAKKLLRGMPQVGVIHLHYEIFVGTKRRLDIMNVGSIIDKYFSDTLTETGIIRDDDFKNIPSVSFSYGGLVKKEHIRVTITEIEPREEALPMRVLLDDNDIEAALTTYVGTLNIPNAAGVKVDVTDGVLTAEVMFAPVDETPTEVVEDKPKKRGRGGRPPGARNKPKTTDPVSEETADVGTPVQAGADLSSAGSAATPEVATPDATPEEAAPAAEGKVRKNLFADKATPSSEDDGAPEAAAGDTPEDVPAPVKPARGSIFDA